MQGQERNQTNRPRSETSVWKQAADRGGLSG